MLPGGGDRIYDFTEGLQLASSEIERWSAGVLLLFCVGKGIDGIFECDYNNQRNIRRMEERGKLVSMIEDKIKYDIRSVVWDE